MPAKTIKCEGCGRRTTPKNLGSMEHKLCKECNAEREAPELESEPMPEPEPTVETVTIKTEKAKKVERSVKEVQREEARKEMARREASRRHLIPFITRFNPKYKVGWVHKIFAAELEKFMVQVEAGMQPRLMIFVPPRHGKSEIVSNNFPSWVLGHHPDWEVIMASHTLSLPLRFSRANRARIKDERYKAVFRDTALNKDSTSAEEWLTTEGGGLKCAGVGGAISGFGAHVLIIDDPIKDYDDAQSETIRETVKNWYTSTAEARLAPQGGVICVQTRWHDDDLSGWQLRMDKENREEGLSEAYLQNWKVISFPAIAEHDEYIDKDTHDFFEESGKNRICVRREGQALHPERYSKDFLLRKKHGSGMPENQWSALYQQNPVPASGEFFREEDFSYYDQAPQLHQYPVLFSWDLAIGLKRENDYTVGAAGVVIPRGGINEVFLLDAYRNRVRDTEQLEAIVNMYARFKDNAFRIGIEQGQIWLAIEMRLRAMFQQRGMSPVFDPELKPVQDKRVRATPLQGWMQNHRVWFPRNQPWVPKARDEMLRFDAGVHDDFVDCFAWMIRMAQRMPLVEKYNARDTWGSEKSVQDMLDDYARNQDSTSGTGYMSA